MGAGRHLLPHRQPPRCPQGCPRETPSVRRAPPRFLWGPLPQHRPGAGPAPNLEGPSVSTGCCRVPAPCQPLWTVSFHLPPSPLRECLCTPPTRAGCTQGPPAWPLRGPGADGQAGLSGAPVVAALSYGFGCRSCGPCVLPPLPAGPNRPRPQRALPSTEEAAARRRVRPPPCLCRSQRQKTRQKQSSGRAAGPGSPQSCPC